MECSKGTYVRSIARDLGQVLGCGACLTSLRREFSAPFSVENAKNVDFVSESDILDPQALFPNLEVVPVEEFEASRLAVGDERVLHDLVERNLHSGLGDMMLYGSQSSGKCLGLLVRRDSHWRFGVNLNS
jgi:tRNA U55 pseudouridine synthase TruB